MSETMSAKNLRSGPRTIVDSWKENWSTFFLIGYLLSIVVANTRVAFWLDQIEIHYRLFLMMLLTTLTFGGFLLTIVRWPAASIICLAAVIVHRRKKSKQFKNGDRK